MSFDQDLPPMFCVNPKSPFGKTLTPRQINSQTNVKKKHYQSITPKKTFNSPNSPRSNLRVGFTRSPVRSPPSSPGRNNSILRSTQQQQPTPNRRTPQSRTLKSLWITVYGFEATTMGSDVLTLFESFGDVVDHRAGLKNSIDLMYSTKEEAEYALAQDGLRVNIGADKTTCIMIGVKPCKSTTTPNNSRRLPQSSGRRRRTRATTPLGIASGGRRRAVKRTGAPPEMETESRHGRSTFQHANQGTNRRYAAVRSSGYRREPRKDLSCCQMAMRYLFPTDW